MFTAQCAFGTLLCFFTLFFTPLDVKTSEHAPRSRLGSSAQPSGFRPPLQILVLQPSTKPPFERESVWSRILMKILFSRAGVGQTCALHGPEGNNSPTGTSVLEWWWWAGGVCVCGRAGRGVGGETTRREKIHQSGWIINRNSGNIFLPVFFQLIGLL